MRKATSIALALVLTGCGLVALADAPASAVTAITQISAGRQFACAVDSAGTASCWGINADGELGDGTTTTSNIPVAVAGGLAFASITAGGRHACALTSGGTAYCWGRNDGGQLGDGTTTQRGAPTAVVGGLSFSKITAGDDHTCGIATGGAAYCWGWGGNGRIGDGTTNNRLSPTAVSGALTYIDISAGKEFTCGIATGGAAYCWGNNGHGRLGDGTTTDRLVPTAVSGGLNFSTVATGYGHACAVTTAGSGYCWGDNGSGRLGDGTTTNRLIPAAVSGGLTFASISAFDSDHTCAVTTAGSGYCWGDNGSGRLGDGTTTDRLVPTSISGGIGWTSLSLGYQYTCGVTSSGGARCWGDNTDGELGNSTFTGSSVPVVVWLQNESENITVSVDVVPSFIFAIANQSSACNGEPNFVSGAGGAASITLGRISSGGNVSGGQTLTVTSNAGNGFSVFVRGTQTSQNLRNTGHNWTDASGSYAAPAALGGGEAFGYTYADATASSSVTNPAAANFIALDNANTNKIMGSSTSSSGTGCISFSVQGSTTTPAGEYAATVVYAAIPAY